MVKASGARVSGWAFSHKVSHKFSSALSVPLENSDLASIKVPTSLRSRVILSHLYLPRVAFKFHSFVVWLN